MGSGIVHETKNYLASVKGYCQLISAQTDDDRIRRYADRINILVGDVNSVISDFLALAKPGQLAFKYMFLKDVILSMRYMLESPSFIKGVKLVYDITDDEKMVKIDDTQIKHVVLNIAKNAIEAMSECYSPALTIRTRLKKETERMQLVIEDNGKGMSQEEKLKIGTPFFTTKKSGTGLGLSVCHRIIGEHNGYITVESELGKGTRFTISLPLCSDALDCTA